LRLVTARVAAKLARSFVLSVFHLPEKGLAA
jgi:hypothetical protein